MEFEKIPSWGRDRAWSESLVYFIIEKTLYIERRDKNFTLWQSF